MRRLEGIVRIKNFKRISCVLILLIIATGVCALLLLFSINEAGKKEILKGIKEKGNSHLLSFDSTFFTQSGKEGGILSHHDIALLKRIPQIEKIALWRFKNIFTIKIDNIEYPPEDASYSVAPGMSGITPEFRDVMDIELKDGRFINRTDLSYKRRVCVVGGKLYERLGGGKIIGKTLIANVPIGDSDEEEIRLTIIGVLHKKIPLFASVPDRAFMNITPLLFNALNKSSDKIEVSKSFQKYQRVFSSLAINDSLFIPWTVWMDFMEEKYLLSSSSLPPYTQIPIKVRIPEGEGIGKYVKDEEFAKLEQESHSCSDSDCEHSASSFLYYFPEKIKEVCDKIRKVLKERWGKDKIFAFTYSGIFIDEIETQVRESNKLLGIIMAVALLLSGTILASTMLISVHKRVGEIGIRRAFGARKKDIFLQFIAEGAVLYSVGIIIGIVVGILGDYLIVSKILHWEFSIPIYGIIISSVFVFLVGILSSLYPALKAANIPPAVAVRYE